MPRVSIIIPCFNEQATIGLLLDALYSQTYPREDIEIIIADGRSTDNTRQVIEKYQHDHPDLSINLVENQKRNIPSGLNRAIEVANGEYILRLDAHSIPAADYVMKSIASLEAGYGDIVGGVWEIRPGGDGWVPRSIALAASHPLGVGDALYRVGGVPQEVDTVPFGAYRRTLIDQIGFYDESLLSNEDYEFNVRVCKFGGIVWLDPEIRSIYFARPDFLSLARQYWRYGYWKLRMLIRYPETFRWRQLSGGFILTWLVLGILSVWFPIARWLLALEAVVYGSALAFSGVQMALRYRNLWVLFGLPVAIAVMHFSWGTAFLWSAVKYAVQQFLFCWKRNKSRILLW
jgi:succinoglycan biosynthesis protein ExoA